MSIRSFLAPCLFASVAGVVVSTGCKKEEPQPSAEEIADAAAQKPALDPSLAKAANAVAAASARPGGMPGGDAAGGPPPNGIFEAGAADKEIKKGAPPIVTLGSTGTEPRVQLTGSSIKPGTKIDGSVMIAVAGGPQKPLPVDFGVSIAAKAVEGSPGLADVVVSVNSVSPAMDQAPPQLAAQLAKLKGSKVEFQVAPNGAGQNFVPTVSKAGAGVQGDQWIRGLSDALATITLPYPEEKVGDGAFWMATSREGVMGLDLVTYRLVRVERATENQVTLSVGTKRYAADTSFNLAGLEGQGSFVLQEFRSIADGTLMLSVGQPVPGQALLKLNLGAILMPADDPNGQPGTVQVQGQARFSFPSAGGAEPGAAGMPQSARPAPGGVVARPVPGGAPPRAVPRPAAPPPAQPAPAQPPTP